MSSSSTGRFSRAARDVFAEIVARADGAAPIDIEREIARHPDLADELRALHVRWSRVEGWLGELAADEATLDSVERALRGPEPLDDATEAELARLAHPDRSRVRYERIELVATGGMGEVWRVVDRDLGRELALKRLKTRSRDPRLLRRFLAEAKLTARLEHPGIVPVHDAGIDDDGRVWFTMPLVRGENLARLLSKHGGDLAEVLECLLKACDAVAYAHARGVVHRDLKPANILLGAFGEVYVVDWGLARAREAQDEAVSQVAHEKAPDGSAHGKDSPNDTRHGDVIGTPAYMPPEQASGRAGAVDPRVDVYALGAILWHALSGRPPYTGASGSAVVEAVKAGAPESLANAAPDAPSELASICDKSMSRDPDARYASVREMADDLRAFVAGRVVRAHRTGALERAVKWCRRNRALSTTIGVAAITLLLVGSLWAWQRGRDATEILRLADLARLQELVRREDELGPLSSGTRAVFEQWLHDATELQQRRASHGAALVALRGQGRFVDGKWVFASEQETFLHGLLSELVEGLDHLEDPRNGLLALVRERVELLQSIEKSSLEAREDWQRTIAEIAAAPEYRGLEMTPIEGLVPIGRDPESRLFEFAHMLSGHPPTRDAEGRLVLDDECGIVLVLLPGGRFYMGANTSGAARDAFGDTWVRDDEGPRRQVELDAFFIGKHEVSRAQWRRIASHSATHASPASMLPAEGMTWDEARLGLERVGLELPTEAQWEYAARGGTTTRWWTGNEPGSLRGSVHGRAAVDPRYLGPGAEAPLKIDALRANGFGLSHVAGNVAEWTLDPWDEAATINLRERDGARLGGDATKHAIRGGSWASDATDLRSTARTEAQQDLRDRRNGVRASRRL